MFKAKIEKINKNNTFYISIPALEFKEVLAHSLTQKGSIPNYAVGDLVLVGNINDGSWVILGYILGQTN